MFQPRLYAVLGTTEIVRVWVHLRKRSVLQVAGLVDVALIHIQSEEIIICACGKIVIIIYKDSLRRQMGRSLAN